jgi:hypothetical protein
MNYRLKAKDKRLCTLETYYVGYRKFIKFTTGSFTTQRESQKRADRAHSGFELGHRLSSVRPFKRLFRGSILLCLCCEICPNC